MKPKATLSIELDHTRQRWEVHTTTTEEEVVMARTIQDAFNLLSERIATEYLKHPRLRRAVIGSLDPKMIADMVAEKMANALAESLVDTIKNSLNRPLDVKH